MVPRSHFILLGQELVGMGRGSGVGVLLLAEAWSRAAILNLLDMRDWLHGRQFFHGKRAGREWGNGWW